MTDICAQVATFLATSLEMTLGQNMFYYSLPGEIDEGIVVQRVPHQQHVPIQLDASVHMLRIAARAATMTTAYALADSAFVALQNDVEPDGGFITLSECTAETVMYDRPSLQEADQQDRKVFDFVVKLITKR